MHTSCIFQKPKWTEQALVLHLEGILPSRNTLQRR